MSDVAIRVEHLYKQYRLGQVSTGTLSHDLNRWWHQIRGKEDPYEKVTVLNERTEKGSNDYVWAIQDINFEIKKGEAVGIIGRNGAGKSTLLKILSKVTGPSKGKIKINGRIASLLEVGTGFHPELTGRENIFLNGAILGMSKHEIKSKFDEIVAFSGVEKYIDTPVKRYSSGMYVRLAFAVAAHLEPEILIVDEVLAVGDAEFQKKCLGKMQDVSKNDGRTILFVSHNMAAVSALCKKGILLRQGALQSFGNMDVVVNEYQKIDFVNKLTNDIKLKTVEGSAYISKAWITTNSQDSQLIDISFAIYIHFNVCCNEDDQLLNLSFTLISASGQTVFNSLSSSFISKKGTTTLTCNIPDNLLNNGLYSVTIVLAKDRSIPLQTIHEVLVFEVMDKRENESWFGDISHHLIRPKLVWSEPTMI